MAHDAEELVARRNGSCGVRMVAFFLGEQRQDVVDRFVGMPPFLREILVGHLTVLPERLPLLVKAPGQPALDLLQFLNR